MSTRDGKGKSLVSVDINDYVALDIETTGLDPNYDEIIEIGALKVQNGREVERFQSLVRPQRPISDYIEELTGISNEMVSAAPSLRDVLPAFLTFTSGQVILGHNVNFDINFLYDEALHHCMRPFPNDYIDTMRLSRRLYKTLPDDKLSTLCSSLSIPQPVEHRAIADCIRTHLCYQAMSRHCKESGISLAAPWEGRNVSAKTISAQTQVFNEDGPIYQKVFVFTGLLEKMSRREAMQAVVDCGGVVGDGVTKKTNYLVLGNNDYCSAIKDGKSSKQKKAEMLQLKGQEIATIPENVFYDMLQDSMLPSSYPAEPSAAPSITEVQAFNLVKPFLLQVLSRNNLDETLLTCSRKKSYSTIAVSNSLVCRLCMRGETSWFSVPENYRKMFPENANIILDSKDSKFVNILVFSKEDIVGHVDCFASILQSVIDRMPKEFDCCSYYLECSDARQCISPNKTLAMGCGYKKVLSSGRIFYGENRNV